MCAISRATSSPRSSASRTASAVSRTASSSASSAPVKMPLAYAAVISTGSITPCASTERCMAIALRMSLRQF